MLCQYVLDENLQYDFLCKYLKDSIGSGMYLLQRGQQAITWKYNGLVPEYKYSRGPFY